MPENILYTGDQAPSLPATIKNAVGATVDLSPYTGSAPRKIEFVFWQEFDTANKFKALAVSTQTAPPPDPSAGTVRYDEAPTDLLVTPGMYRGQWVLTDATARAQHVDAGRFTVKRGH